MSRLTRDGTLNPSRETKFPTTYEDRRRFNVPVQLTTSRIGNLTRLIHTLAIYVMTMDTYILHTYQANINWSMVICQGSTRSELP